MIIKQIEKDISASGKSGSTIYRFVSLKNGSEYAPFIKPENAGGIVMSRAGNSMSAADRHSSTDIDIDLPDGTLIKEVDKTSRGSTTRVYIVEDDDSKPVKYIGARKNDGAWDTVIEIDGERVTISG